MSSWSSEKSSEKTGGAISQQLLTLLKIMVSVGLLVFIFTQIDTATLLTNIRQVRVGWLLLAIGVMFLGVVIRAWRWKVLLNSIDMSVPLSELTAIYLIGFLFNNLAPSGIGGDVMRVVELRQHNQRATDATTSILVERFLGLIALQTIGLIALLFDWAAVPIELAYLTVAMFLTLLITGYLFINQHLYKFLQENLSPFRRLTKIKVINKLFESFQSYPGWAIRQAYGVSLLFNGTLISMNICIGTAVGVQATIAQYAIFIPITSAVLIIPFTVGGLGIREGTYVGLFREVGVPEETALAMSLFSYAIGNLCSGVIGGFVYLARIILGKS